MPTTPTRGYAPAHAAVVCGLGAVTGNVPVPNSVLAERLDVSDEWIRSRTGISHRYVAAEGTSTADLAVAAAERALASCGGQPVQALVLASVTPDGRCPAMAPTVADCLGFTGIAAHDLAAACSGILYAAATAAGFIAAGVAERVLVIGADRMSALADADDARSAPLFGDGAGAMVLRRGTPGEPGALGPIVLGSDGTHANLITAAHGARLKLAGPETFRHAVDWMSQAASDAADAAGWTGADIDLLVPHQANARITAAVGRRLAITPDRVVDAIAHTGNTSAASIPLALAQACADEQLRPGHKVLLAAFGAGLTWAATTLTWPQLAHPVPSPDSGRMP